MKPPLSSNTHEQVDELQQELQGQNRTVGKVKNMDKTGSDQEMSQQFVLVSRAMATDWSCSNHCNVEELKPLSKWGRLKLQHNQLFFLPACVLSCRPDQVFVLLFTAHSNSSVKKSSSLFSISCKLADPIQLLAYAKCRSLGGLRGFWVRIP